VKFRGAGQGAKVLVAELIVGGIATRLGLPVPELALVDVSSRFGRSEPDPEIQQLLRKSHGVNVGMRYLEGAFNFESSAAGELISEDLAARIVWLDSFTTNPDRTHRNPNLLIWNRTPWLIDHGAALYAHHDWSSVDEARARSPFQMIRTHVLLTIAGDLAAANQWALERVTPKVLGEVLAMVPDELLMDDGEGATEFASADAARERYVSYLSARLAAHDRWLGEALAAQQQRRIEQPLHMKARR
jgi:hypothetical protein